MVRWEAFRSLFARDMGGWMNDSLLAMPAWFVRLAVAAGMSALEAATLWLRYHGCPYHEIAAALGRRERAVRDAAARGRAAMARLPALPIAGPGGSLAGLQARLYREALELLEAIRNESARRGGTPGGEEHLPRPRLVTADDLVDERLRRLFGEGGA